MFSEQQLELIKSVAHKKKNQGEVSIARSIWQNDASLFTNTQLQVILYCAEECKRQHSGEMSVYDMILAWSIAYDEWNTWEIKFDPNTSPYGPKRVSPPITLDFIEIIGKYVEPIDNKKGFRTIPIGVWDGHIWHEKAQYAEIPRLLEHLLNSYYEGVLFDTEPCIGDPSHQYHSHDREHELAQSAEDQFYYEYEEIHPFVDGNGRSGKILYNYLLGRLDDPIMPPNFFGSANP